MIIAIRKEPNGTLYMDKNIYSRTQEVQDEQGNITIQTEGRKVNVLSMPQQMKVEAYSAMGVLVKTAEGNSGAVTLTLPTKGVYMIKAYGERSVADRKVVTR